MSLATAINNVAVPYPSTDHQIGSWLSCQTPDEAQSQITHPNSIPIYYLRHDIHPAHSDKNPHCHGPNLCFSALSPLQQGASLELIIPLHGEMNRFHGIVISAQPHTQGDFLIRVGFPCYDEAYRIRMVEQICHIEEYRQKVYREEGRQLDQEQAAQEWIQKYAANFPGL